MKSISVVDILNNPILESKIQTAVEGLGSWFLKLVNNMSPENIIITIDFISAMKVECNVSDNHKKNLIIILSKLSSFLGNKCFKEITRDNILQFLDNFHKPESSDPLHKWIGTYNLYRVLLVRFFKWLYFPDMEQDKRQKPPVIQNIPQLRRKELSTYKPSDLWTEQDHVIFLKYCPNLRDRCYHAIARDSSCRVHEILALKLKDIIFKSAENYQYAEVLVNGKTGSRQIPLIDSIPYLKDWLDNHPQKGNPNAFLICGFGKSLGRRISSYRVNRIYHKYKVGLFTKLISEINSDLPSQDKQIITQLLNKPWNPYILRHSALTDKSKVLKEHVLRQHAGWSGRSQMHLKYLHYFGNESSESILEAYGIVTTNEHTINSSKPKQCPNCLEPNKPDSKFCVKCRMVLVYDEYLETLEREKQKENEVEYMKKRMNILEEGQKELLELLKHPRELLDKLTSE
jgi:integrase